MAMGHTPATPLLGRLGWEEQGRLKSAWATQRVTSCWEKEEDGNTGGVKDGMERGEEGREEEGGEKRRGEKWKGGGGEEREKHHSEALGVREVGVPHRDLIYTHVCSWLVITFL